MLTTTPTAGTAIKNHSLFGSCLSCLAGRAAIDHGRVTTANGTRQYTDKVATYPHTHDVFRSAVCLVIFWGVGRKRCRLKSSHPKQQKNRLRTFSPLWR